MNQEREEKAIRELFRQLRRDDELSAGPFAASLAEARSRSERFRFLRPVAVAIVLLLLAGGAWLLFSKRSAKPLPQVDLVNSMTPAPNVQSPPAPEPTPSTVVGQAVQSRRHRQKPLQSRPATLLVSEWRSPTISLLRAPGEQLLKTVPRLDESLIEIRPLAPSQRRDQQN